MNQEQLPTPDELIEQAAGGARRLTDDELQRVREHVARAGFDAQAREAVRGRLAGRIWRGRVLRGADRLPAVEVHYLWHVIEREEWPLMTTLADYIDSIRQIVLDPDSGVFTNHYRGALSLGVIREARDLRGPAQCRWALVQYRVERGHWTTAFQPRDGLAELANPDWGDIRWLCEPTISDES